MPPLWGSGFLILLHPWVETHGYKPALCFREFSELMSAEGAAA